MSSLYQALLVVLLIVLAVAAAWWWRNRYGTQVRDGLLDGTQISIVCRANAPPEAELVDAWVTMPDGSTVPAYDSIAPQFAQGHFVVRLNPFEAHVGATLSIRYRCPATTTVEHFYTHPDSEHHESASAVEHAIAKSDAAVAAAPHRNLPPNGGDCRRREKFSQIAARETPDNIADRAMSLMVAVSGRRTGYHKTGTGGTAKVTGTDFDTDFVVDGVYERELAAGLTNHRETLTSGRGDAEAEVVADLMGLGGLGTRRRDPRFQPGEQTMLYGRTGNSAHGLHAGGDTLGAFTPDEFRHVNTWNSKYVHGMDNYHDAASSMSAI